MTSFQDEPRRWRLDAALRENADLTSAQIEEIKAAGDALDLVELAMGLEEKFGIEIEDEDFFGSFGQGFHEEL